MRVQKLSCLLLIMMLSFSFIGCNNKTKDIVISNNVKKDVQQEEKKDVKLQKLNEFTLDKEYEPLYWKDDENIIAIKQDGSRDSGIFDINANTSQITKISDYNESNVSALFNKLGIGSKENRLLFIKDSKLWLYNINDNTSKAIYDLSEVKSWLEKKYANCTIKRTFDKNGKAIYSQFSSEKGEGTEPFTVKYDSDFALGFKASFVSGSNKYICLDCYDGLKILDLDSGKITELNYYQDMYKQIFYSKAKDTFYIMLDNIVGSQGHYRGVLYEFKLNKPDAIKKITQINGMIPYTEMTSVSEDGKNLYFMTRKENGDNLASDSIICLDTIKNTTKKLFENNSGEMNYNFIHCNYNNGLAIYSCRDTYLGVNDNTAAFLGRLTNGKLRVIDKITETTGTDIVCNQIGDRLLFRSIPDTNSSENGKVKVYVYAVIPNNN